MKAVLVRWGGWPVLLAVLLLGGLSASAATPPASPPSVPSKCARETDRRSGFAPRAITLTPVNVRAALPEYSLLKGQWVLGQVTTILPADTCLVILDRQEVGVVQLWYFVQYQDSGTRSLRTGWVWGGTSGKDEERYIGGDRTPVRRQSTSPALPGGWPWTWLVGVAHAQADEPPLGVGASPPKDTGLQYDVQLPLVGLTLNFVLASAIGLFLAMVLGMLAKAVWDETDRGRLRPRPVKLVRPLLISPIAFSAFWGTMYLQMGSAGISVTMVLYAFQIGFMWQHVLEKVEAEKG